MNNFDNVLTKVKSIVEAIETAEQESLDKKQVAVDPVVEDMPRSMRLQVGDMVSFTYEGLPYKGAIEYASDDSTLYTVRVYAESNGKFEPTDMLFDIPVDADIAMLTDEGFQKGMFVSFQSKDGATIGVITTVGETDITVEVIDEYKGENVFTGIEVTHPVQAFKLVAPLEVADRDHKILAKIKEAKMDIMETENGSIGVIEGLASTYGNTDLGGDIVRKGAFTQTLGHKGGKVLLLFDHGYKTKDIAGVAYLNDSEKGLMLRGEMPLDDPEVKSQYAKLKFVLDRGVPMGLSIGYNTKAKNMLQDGRRELLEVALEEVSITPFPMNTEARITSAKTRRLIFATKSLLWSQLDAPVGNSQV
jgi:HK97 family phage prohead protease